MAESKSGPELIGNAGSATETPGSVGEVAVAKKNRQRETRLRIIQGFERVGLSYDQWPDFVREYYADPSQRTHYHHVTFVSPFQAPAFDRLNQSPEDWAKLADKEWQRHRNKCLEQCESWVTAGMDDEIEPVKVLRGPGRRKPARVESPKRGINAPVERRYEWAARYLARVPLKEIAGENADPSTVGRIARKIIREGGWSTKSRWNQPAAQAPDPGTHQEYPKYKYHRTEPARIVQNPEEELALGDGWENTPPLSLSR